MESRLLLFLCLLGIILNITFVTGQTTTAASTTLPTSTSEPPTLSIPASSISPTASISTTKTTNSTTTTSSHIPGATGSTAPDVYLNVPNLSVGRIELDVDNLQADINLNAAVAGLVSVNAGVAVSIKKVNLTITDVAAELELIVRLGNLVEIVERVFNSLDLNPLLISLLNNVTDLVGGVIGAVDGLLGTITQGETTLSFVVDNLGNIVQEVVGGATGALSTIVGNYLQNMTFTGDTKPLDNGLTQKTYSYEPLNALVNIVFNTVGQVVQATVVKGTAPSRR